MIDELDKQAEREAEAINRMKSYMIHRPKVGWRGRRTPRAASSKILDRKFFERYGNDAKISNFLL